MLPQSNKTSVIPVLDMNLLIFKESISFQSMVTLSLMWSMYTIQFWACGLPQFIAMMEIFVMMAGLSSKLFDIYLEDQA